MVDHFRDIWGKSIDAQNWGHVLVQIVNKADKGMGSYEPTYRKRLSSLVSCSLLKTFLSQNIYS
jgi:hypothetical protein